MNNHNNNNINTNNTVPRPPSQSTSPSSLLYGFDIQDEASAEFLASLIASGHVPKQELDEFVELSLLRGQEEWDMIFCCARALREKFVGNGRVSPGLRLEPFLAYVLSGGARGDHATTAAGGAGKAEGKGKGRGGKKKSLPKRATSRFWTDEKEGLAERKVSAVKVRKRRDGNGDDAPAVLLQRADSAANEGALFAVGPESPDPGSLLEDIADTATTPTQPSPADDDPGSLVEEPPSPRQPLPPPFQAHHHSPHLHTPRLSRAHNKSPFFLPCPSPSKRPRPARGTISSLPFPPLSASRFGLIQESLSHDPFRLLVAVTFLIRTAGKAAIPVFWRVVERWGTPEAFVACDAEGMGEGEGEEEGDGERGGGGEQGEGGVEGVARREGGLERELEPMIRHLGLGGVRCKVIRRYARGWTETPPERGRRFVVRGYPRLPIVEESLGEEEIVKEEATEEEVKVETEKDVGMEEPTGEEGVEADKVLDGGDEEKVEATETPKKRRKSKLNSSEWEIGHLTQGRYAIDSWRIFCRDIFLGKSDSWMGRTEDRPVEVEGEEEEEFEPEWKRVLPEDKELRACLRWMWMREGFEWDPLTGRRGELREDMRDAVEEGRVKYDDRGELVIIDREVDGDEIG